MKLHPTFRFTHAALVLSAGLVRALVRGAGRNALLAGLLVASPSLLPGAETTASTEPLHLLPEIGAGYDGPFIYSTNIDWRGTPPRYGIQFEDRPQGLPSLPVAEPPSNGH